MSLYSQGNAFSRKVVNRKVLALILNFSTVGHGGAYGGGVWIILAYEPEGSTSILWKRHIFKAVGGAIMGGRLLGCFNGGADGGGAFWHTWRGAGGAFDTTMEHFLPRKMRYFYLDIRLSMISKRPPIHPP